MTDGISESRREEAAIKRIQIALNQLCDALEDVHDSAFGLPLDSILQMCQALKPYGVTVLSRTDVGKYLAQVTSPLSRDEAVAFAKQYQLIHGGEYPCLYGVTSSAQKENAREELTSLLLRVAGRGISTDPDHG